MSAVKKPIPFDWGLWLRSFGVYLMGFVGLLITFYFTTTNTLQKHEEKFAEIGKKFDTFNTTLKDNYENWAKTNKSEVEKAEIRAKEERELRDKMREEFRQTFTNFATSSTAVRVQVDTITKQLDNVTKKIDDISNVQQQNRSDILSGKRR